MFLLWQAQLSITFVSKDQQFGTDSYMMMVVIEEITDDPLVIFHISQHCKIKIGDLIREQNIEICDVCETHHHKDYLGKQGPFGKLTTE